MSQITVKSDFPKRRADSVGSVNGQRKELMEYLDRYLNHCLKNKIKGALVYDIDDTIIENSGKEIPDVMKVYKKYAPHFDTYLVTARPAIARQETQKMLHKMNIPYKGLYLLPVADEQDPGKFKYRMRCNFKKKYGRVLAAVGDQVWDALPHPVPREYNDLKYGPRGGALVQCGPKEEVGVLLPSS